ITNCRRNIETCAFIEIRLWPFVSENILPVVGSERPGVFPLRIGGSVALTDRHPASFAGGYRGPLIGLVEPRNNIWRFGTMTLLRFVVIGQCTVEGIESRGEFHRHIIAAMSRIRVIRPTVLFSPLCVPRAHAIGDGIVGRRFLANPENGSDNIAFPRVTLSRLEFCRQLARGEPK